MSCTHCHTQPARVASRHLESLAFCGAECRDAYICATHQYMPHGDEHCLVPIGAAVVGAFRRWPELHEDARPTLEHCLHDDGRSYVLPRALVQAIGVTLEQYKQMSEEERAAVPAAERAGHEAAMRLDEMAAGRRRPRDEEEAVSAKRATLETPLARLPSDALGVIIGNLDPRGLVRMAGTSKRFRDYIAQDRTMIMYFTHRVASDSSEGSFAKKANKLLDSFANITALLPNESVLTIAILDGFTAYLIQQLTDQLERRVPLQQKRAEAIYSILSLSIRWLNAAFLRYAIRVAAIYGLDLDLNSTEVIDRPLYETLLMKADDIFSTTPLDRPLRYLNCVEVLLDWRSGMGARIERIPESVRWVEYFVQLSGAKKLTRSQLALCGRWGIRSGWSVVTLLQYASKIVDATKDDYLAFLQARDGADYVRLDGLRAGSPVAPYLFDEVVRDVRGQGAILFPQVLTEWRGPAGQRVRIDLLFGRIISALLYQYTNIQGPASHRAPYTEAFRVYASWRSGDLFCDVMSPSVLQTLYNHYSTTTFGNADTVRTAIVEACKIPRPLSAPPLRIIQGLFGSNRLVFARTARVSQEEYGRAFGELVTQLERSPDVPKDALVISKTLAMRLVLSVIVGDVKAWFALLRVYISPGAPASSQPSLANWLVGLSARGILNEVALYNGLASGYVEADAEIMTAYQYYELFLAHGRPSIWFCLAARGAASSFDKSDFWATSLYSTYIILLRQLHLVNDFVTFWNTNHSADAPLIVADDLLSPPPAAVGPEERKRLAAIARFFMERANGLSAPDELPTAADDRLVAAALAVQVGKMPV